MIKILMFTGKQDEVSLIRMMIARYSLVHSWAESAVLATTELEEWRQWTQSEKSVDVLICDVAIQRTLVALTAAKKRNPQALVVPIAGQSVSPTIYVRPEIMPFCLLWRPLTEVSAEQTISSLFSALHAAHIPKSESQIEVKTRQRTQYIPYRDICYFEAREKRVFLRTAHREVSLRCTLRQLEDQLPKEFVRCHKSYLVNRDHILSVDFADQYIEMDGQMFVPLSRNYKSRFQEDTT
ncbi:MAG: LytTR family transcriptional regulator [Clostridiales bacterium]|nr:LytTR family transcriptional regulator [Clostridiales bacterium]